MLYSYFLRRAVRPGQEYWDSSGHETTSATCQKIGQKIVQPLCKQVCCSRSGSFDEPLKGTALEAIGQTPGESNVPWKEPG